MKNVTYNDGMKSGKRVPALFVFKPGKDPVRFQGKSVPEVLAIVGQKYTKQGQWSYTDWTLSVGDNTTVVEICPRLHGKRFTDYSSVEALMTNNEVNYGSSFDFTQVMTPEQFLNFLSAFFPAALEIFNQTQNSLSNLD